MKTGTKVVVALVLALGGAVVAFAQQQTFTGTLTDKGCLSIAKSP